MAMRKAKIEKGKKKATNGRRKPRDVSGGGVELPAGFTEVEAAHMAGFWKPKERGDRLIGVVGKAQEGPGLNGKPNRFYQVMLTSDDCGPFENRDKEMIECGGGELVGCGTWAWLLPFLQQHENRSDHEVYIIYMGDDEPQSGKSAAKLFKTGFRKRED